MASEQFPSLVVIGSSAGGIEALGTLLSALPQDFPAPIVIAQHIDPHRPSHLGEILARRGKLPVRTIQDHQELESGVVFVVPSNRHVAIEGHAVILRQDGAAGPVPSVDLLFRSAAEAYGEGLVAVILSGMGSDGAAGARHVKQHGGTVIIENPATADFPSMPQSLAPTTVDIVADIDKIGALLSELLSGRLIPPRPDAERTLETLLEDLRDRSGIDFGSYKRPTIERRLGRRMAATGRRSLQEYMDYLEDNPEEYQRLVNSFLIKVTDFFRDAELFDRLRTVIVPDVVEQARSRSKEIRIWSAGCATGEEAYSLGILISECLGDELDSFRVRIFATDLDNDAVNFARRGIYQAPAVATLDRDLVAKYFTEEDGQYEVKKRIRAFMVFGQHDLGQRAPFPHIDLILCRNVLIYFTSELQRRALQLFAFSLRNGGYLALGKAETTSPLPEYFAPEAGNLKIFRRHGDRILVPPGRLVEAPTPAAARTLSRRRFPSSAQQRPTDSMDLVRGLSERIVDDLFRQLPVGVVVIDSQYDVQRINTVGRQLLGIYSAAIGDDFVHLVQGLPARELQAAIDLTFRERTSNTLDEVEVEIGSSGETRHLDVDCYPVGRAEKQGAPQLVLIVVTDVTSRVQQRRKFEQAAAQAVVEREQAAIQLRRLVESNRELLQANAELTTVNMELRGSNEEFLVNNEEVQAATEEVETLNEELQATNEELETLNEELQATVEELNTTNDDVQARSAELQELAAMREEQRHQLEDEKARLEVILSSLGAAVLVVDAAGQPLLTNTTYQQMFGSRTTELRAEDSEGRPLPEHDLPQRRAAAGESFRMEFTLRAGEGQRRWFEAIGNPLRRANGEGQPSSAGAVIVIRDVTDRSLLRLQEQFLAIVSHELRTPLTALSGFLQLLGRSIASEEGERPRQVDLATQQARRLGTLIDELSDVTRLQTGKLQLHSQELDLVQLVRNTVDIAHSLSGGREIGLQLPPGPLTIQADPGRLEQVIMNLLNNALAHTGPQDRIEVHLKRNRGAAEIQVQDAGPGIPAADLANLFTPYYQVGQASPQQTGLGLGLFIVKQFVDAHGGNISVESEVGKGTTFTVHLPI